MVVDDEHADRVGRIARPRGPPLGGGGGGAALPGHRHGFASLGILAHLSRGVEQTPLPPFTVSDLKLPEGRGRPGAIPAATTPLSPYVTGSSAVFRVSRGRRPPTKSENAGRPGRPRHGTAPVGPAGAASIPVPFLTPRRA
ncbi:hypothetical protein GCM10009727_34440 [Actinomadura napierensis]|uniref:Uncharacterized protein n=1 Tax=Actinomadura napierensis TaxID=267854 RepID=A0ABP5KZQ8_9ACTN